MLLVLEPLALVFLTVDRLPSLISQEPSEIFCAETQSGREINRYVNILDFTILNSD